jgi:plastocyanin
MRRVFALLLLTPLVASCADSATPVAPAGAMLSEGAAPTEEAWPAEENWFTPEGVLALEEDEMSMQIASAPEGDLSTQAMGATAAPAPGALMTLGNPTVGSPYPNSHDGSFHANDRMIPGTVVINAGEIVTFKMFIGHRLAIYNNGVQPKDIQPTPGPLLLYPVGRLYLQPSPAQQIRLKFTKPGKYLVVCAINKHFFVANMWGWVHVK